MLELTDLASSEMEDIHSLRAAVIVLEPDGRVRLWNLAARSIFGVSAGDAANRSFAELARRRLGSAADRVLGALETRAPLRTFDDEGTLAVSVLPRSSGSIVVVRPTDPVV